MKDPELWMFCEGQRCNERDEILSRCSLRNRWGCAAAKALPTTRPLIHFMIRRSDVHLLSEDALGFDVVKGEAFVEQM